MAVNYEWCIEEYDIDAADPEAEIVDHRFGDKLIEVGFATNRTELLVLVRTTDEGDRCWAYVNNSHMLPKYFSIPKEDGKYYEIDVAVPQRFHREIARIACG